MLRKFVVFILSAILSVIPSAAYAFSSVDFYNAAQGYRSVNPFGAAVHCSLETGNWKSRLWTEGKNGAGIKATKAWKVIGLPYIDTITEEDINGEVVPQKASFRKYSGMDQFLRDYSRKIRDSYPVSAKYYKNIWGYLCGLYIGKYGRWATDSRYFEKLTKVAVGLAPQIYGAKWHSKLARQFKTAKKFNILQKWQIGIIAEVMSRYD
ncbi:MAG: glucosaminidase domain-containing protein [Synergistes sp.]|nr:glucosaminidase domain-containing protein [Synergistes sp.]